MKRYKINNMDVMDWAKKYKGPKFHALLTDAPYHLTTITKRFGKLGSVPAKFGTDGLFQRAGRGFMNTEWDGNMISFNPEMWAALGEHLYPGAFGMTFGGSRTAHRIAVAIEDAGFIIHPMIGWVYGCLSEDTEVLTDSGFKRYHKITNYDRILAYDNQTNIYQWEYPQKWQEYEVHKDTAYRIESDSTSQIVSKSHRCLVERKGKLIFIQAEQLNGVEYMPYLQSTFLGIQEILKGLLFKGMQWTSSRRGVGKVCSSSQKSLEQKVRTRISKKDDWSRQSSMERRPYLSKAKRFICQSINKVCKMSKRIFGYGSQRWLCYGTSFVGSTSNWKTTDQTRSSSSYQSQCRGQSFEESNVVQYQQGTQAVRTRSGYKTTLATITPIEYSGLIFCPTVSTGAFVARRSGKIFITGNSGFPKATRVKGHKEFDGHRYGLQALKPSLEPIIVFQKPYDDKPIVNIATNGAGALNIDAGRIPTTDEYVINRFDDGMKPFGNGAGHKYKSFHVPQSNPKNRRGVVGSDFGFNGSSLEKYQDAQRKSIERMESLGRWPANFILDNSVSNVLDAQSGHLKSGNNAARSKEGYFGAGNHKHGGLGAAGDVQITYGDNGGASRFFYNVQTQLDSADPFKYQKKASTKERNAGLDEKNIHPTVKPIDLNRYLASLLLPPIDYAPRRILVPFSGVMSEGIGALLAGWEYVEAIELGKHYCELGEKRVKYWLK